MAAAVPRGKKRSAAEAIRALLVKESPRALAVLVALMCDEQQKPELRIKAAESILDRACGKPGSVGVGGSESGGEIAVRFEGALEEWSR